MIRKIAQKGFTLLELMLVIALIGVIMVFSLSIYQQQSVNFKVDKTALQMQAWLEAARTFYTNCGQWPGTVDGTYNSIDQLRGYTDDGKGNLTPVITCNGKDSDKRSGVSYISSSMLMSPWNTAYQLYLPDSPNNPYNSQGGTTKLFVVSTGVVNAIPNLTAILNRIAGRLPNSNAYPFPPAATPSQAIAGILPSGPGSGGNSGVMFIKVMLVSSNDIILKPGAPDGPPACPSNMTSKLYLSANKFDAGFFSPTQPIATTGVQTVIAEDTNTYWKPQLIVTAPQGEPQVIMGNQMIAIITCEAPNTNKPPNLNAANSPFTF